MFDTFSIQPRTPLTDAEIQHNLITAMLLRGVSNDPDLDSVAKNVA